MSVTPRFLAKLKAFQSALAIGLAANDIVAECPEPGDLSDWAMQQRANSTKRTAGLAEACEAEARADYAGQLGV